MQGPIFSKTMIAVEMDGKPYGVALSAEKLIQVLKYAAEISPEGKLDIRPIPNPQFFELAMQKPQA